MGDDVVSVGGRTNESGISVWIGVRYREGNRVNDFFISIDFDDPSRSALGDHGQAVGKSAKRVDFDRTSRIGFAGLETPDFFAIGIELDDISEGGLGEPSSVSQGLRIVDIADGQFPFGVVIGIENGSDFLLVVGSKEASFGSGLLGLGSMLSLDGSEGKP